MLGLGAHMRQPGRTGTLLTRATEVAERYAISVYDAACAAADDEGGHRLISCDERDLVSKDLAVLEDVPPGPGMADQRWSTSWR